jgi:hypothetical protein
VLVKTGELRAPRDKQEAGIELHAIFTKWRLDGVHRVIQVEAASTHAESLTGGTLSG